MDLIKFKKELEKLNPGVQFKFVGPFGEESETYNCDLLDSVISSDKNVYALNLPKGFYPKKGLKGEDDYVTITNKHNTADGVYEVYHIITSK